MGRGGGERSEPRETGIAAALAAVPRRRSLGRGGRPPLKAGSIETSSSNPVFVFLLAPTEEPPTAVLPLARARGRREGEREGESERKRVKHEQVVASWSKMRKNSKKVKKEFSFFYTLKGKGNDEGQRGRRGRRQGRRSITDFFRFCYELVQKSKYFDSHKLRLPARGGTTGRHRFPREGLTAAVVVAVRPNK